VANANLPSNTLPTDSEEINKLLLRAQKGDEKTLPVLRELIKQPHIMEIFGNAASHAEKAIIRKFARDNLAAEEGLRRKMDCLRAELAGPTPSPLERLLAERIAACWLHVNYLEAIFGSQDNPTLNVGMYYQKAIDRAHKRYLSAIKTLAVVRKLALPVLQVNIAKKQVNVAGPCVGSKDEKRTIGDSG
jgi:hypothetical protein